jgi:hypothetical protein
VIEWVDIHRYYFLLLLGTGWMDGGVGFGVLPWAYPVGKAGQYGCSVLYFGILIWFYLLTWFLRPLTPVPWLETA